MAGSYRIRLRGPNAWELTYHGRLLELHTRRSAALAWAERHRRETQRTQQISRWAMLAGAALVVAIVAVNQISELWGLAVFVVSVWVLLSSVARAVASATRNLLDPYRSREKWEPSDWWNDNH